MVELLLIVGHVGAGKTTRALELASQTGAVRLSPDEWMAPLFGHPDRDGKRDVLEGRLIWTATQILRAGASVILDFGLWGREERAALAWLAEEAGAVARTVYVPVDRSAQAERVAHRWRSSPCQTWEVTQDDLDSWRSLLEEPDAAELAGTYAAEPPVDGWSSWLTHRWPTALEALRSP